MVVVVLIVKVKIINNKYKIIMRMMMKMIIGDFR